MRMSESVKEITLALIAAQSELPTIIKDKLAKGDKFSYRYVSLDTVMPEALKILNKNGMALVQTVGGADAGGTTLSTTILHSSGEWIGDTQPLLLVKPDPQGQGSAITYARRYGLMAILGLVADDDDDGAAASPRDSAPVQRTEPQQKSPERADGAFLMILKRDGECLQCNQPISKGTNAFYSREQGAVWHERCDVVKQPALLVEEDPGASRE